jgi:hypothetical protein
LTNNANTNCGVVADPSRGIVAPLPADYTCGFFESLGPNKQKYIIYTFLKGPIAAGSYKFKFRLQSPSIKGSHALAVMTMARFYPTIYFYKKYFDIFSAENDIWAVGYPKLYYSFNLDANNAVLEDQIGLFSMSTGFHKIFNSIKFIVKADAIINPLLAKEKHTLEIIVGGSDAVVPLGYVYDDIPTATGFADKLFSYNSGRLRIDNVMLASGTEYTISLKVGYPTDTALPTDADRGLGLITLFKGSVVLFRSRSLMRPRFNVINKNRHLMTVDNVERNDAFKRKHRGFSAFRSAAPVSVFTTNDYLVSTGTNGLRIGDG